jgi:hypothetical protein
LEGSRRDIVELFVGRRHRTSYQGVSTKEIVGGIITRIPTRTKYLGKDSIGPLFLQTYTRKFPFSTSSRYSMEKERCNPCLNPISIEAPFMQWSLDFIV